MIAHLSIPPSHGYCLGICYPAVARLEEDGLHLASSTDHPSRAKRALRSAKRRGQAWCNLCMHEYAALPFGETGSPVPQAAVAAPSMARMTISSLTHPTILVRLCQIVFAICESYTLSSANLPFAVNSVWLRKPKGWGQVFTFELQLPGSSGGCYATSFCPSL